MALIHRNIISLLSVYVQFLKFLFRCGVTFNVQLFTWVDLRVPAKVKYFGANVCYVRLFCLFLDIEMVSSLFLYCHSLVLDYPYLLIRSGFMHGVEFFSAKSVR